MCCTCERRHQRRADITSIHASDPQSSFKDARISPTLLMKALALAGVCSFHSPRGLRYMTRREIFSNYDANGQNTFGKRPGSKRHVCSRLFCHPGARSLSGRRCPERRRGPSLFLSLWIYMQAHEGQERMRASTGASCNNNTPHDPYAPQSLYKTHFLVLLSEVHRQHICPAY